MSDTENAPAVEMPTENSLPTQDEATDELIRIRLASDGPQRPADGSMHDLIAWLEARLAWLEGLMRKV